MKAIANIATFKGREKYLENTLGSIFKQFDEINIYDNEVEEIDLTDRGKFAFLDKYTEPVYYFTLDDDIIYPANYVDSTIMQIEKVNAIITYHGRLLKAKGVNYYRGHKSYHCSQMNSEFIKIHVPGTGVTAFRTDYFKPSLEDMRDDKMADLLFAEQAAKSGKDIYLGLKPPAWFTIQPIPLQNTIFGTEVFNCKRQGQIADDILSVFPC